MVGLKDKKIKISISVVARIKKGGFIGINIDPDSEADIIASAFRFSLWWFECWWNKLLPLVEHFTLDKAQKIFDEIYWALKKDEVANLKIDRDWTKSDFLKKIPTNTVIL